MDCLSGIRPPTVKQILYCGGNLKTEAIIIGAFDIVISIGLIIWFLTQSMVDFDEKEFEEEYANYVIGTTCTIEAIRGDGSFDMEQIFACARCWDHVNNDTLSEEGLSMAKACVEQYSSNVNTACQEQINGLQVGDDKQAQRVFSCFLKYIMDKDEDKIAQAHVAEHQQIWDISKYNFTLDQFEQHEKENEEKTTAFSIARDVIRLVLQIFILLVGSLLIFGATKEKSVFLTPWLVVYTLYILFTMINITHGLVTAGANWTSAMEIFFVVVDCYSFFLVFSYRKQLRNGEINA